MSFKFNFFSEPETDGEDKKSASDPPVKPFSEVSADLEKPLEEYDAEAFPLGSLTLYYVSERKIEDDIKESTNEVSAAVKENSDLVPNVYEGGLKIWESSLDLVEYFAENEMLFEHKKILELGCGAGLPSLYALRQGADLVHFADYNDAVLQKVTIPNAHLNCEEDNSCSLDKCKFFAGDWQHLQKSLSEKALLYDIIFTSETIYSRDCFEKLHNIMSALLSDSGVVYLAAKIYYFGVGGGLREFEVFLKQNDVFDYETCKICGEGVHREILKLTKKKKT